MRSALVLALPVALLAVGCSSSKRDAPGCRGPLVVLNAAHWIPTPADIAALEAACPEGR